MEKRKEGGYEWRKGMLTLLKWAANNLKIMASEGKTINDATIEKCVRATHAEWTPDLKIINLPEIIRSLRQDINQ